MKDRKRIKRLNPLRAYFPIFVLPTLAAFIIGFLYPFIRGIYLSFCTFRTTSDAKWVGLDNYIKAFNDEGFFHAFWYTALFTVVSVVVINLFASTGRYSFSGSEEEKPRFFPLDHCMGVREPVRV